MFHAFAIIIFINILMGGFQYMFTNDINYYKNTKTVNEHTIEKYFSSNCQSGHDLPINIEESDLEENLDDYQTPLDCNNTDKNYQIMKMHYINLNTFYNVAFNPEVIPPPPKVRMNYL